MGSGKSYWGKVWGDKYGLNFYDLDEIIEEMEGLTINEIFAQKGEAYFRAIESKALKTFAFQDNYLLACGGGTPCFFDNIDWMNDHGITIFLDTSPETILQRLSAESSQRPLIKQMNSEEIIDFTKDKIAERSSYYLRSAFILPESKQNHTSLSILNL